MSFLLALTFLLTPTYALRFSIFGFSANLLMVWVFALWVITTIYFSAKNYWRDFFEFVLGMDKKILILTGVFFLAGLISLFDKGFNQQKLGQFIVLFLQPISVFFITGYIFHKDSEKKSQLLASCYLLLALMGFYAIVQYLTLLGLPPAWWGNNEEPRRALGFFGHPNFYALFSAPLLAFLLPDLFRNLKSKILNLKSLAWLLGAVGLFLSLSRAGWLGLAVAFAVYLLVAADKKIRKIALGAAAIMVIVIVMVPNWRYRVILPFYGEKSAVSRLSLWQTGWKGVKEAPITGLGLTGFAQAWPRLNTDPGLADVSHNFPHNIFLDLWVEAGLIGLISLIGLMGLYIYRGLRLPVIPSEAGRNDIIKLSVALFLIALLAQGLIDNPYFKNDLAIIFWMILAMPNYNES